MSEIMVAARRAMLSSPTTFPGGIPPSHPWRGLGVLRVMPNSVASKVESGLVTVELGLAVATMSPSGFASCSVMPLAES
jgi:hypothetical protein